MNFESNMRAVHYKVEQACRKWARDPKDVEIIAVSKKQPLERVVEALENGHRVFGENIVQAAKATWGESGLKNKYPDVKLHLIGALQTNKVKDAVALFDSIQTVDRPSVIDALVKEVKKQNKTPEFFIQVNTGEEEQKAGVCPSELPRLLDYAREKEMKISGLMCIPPFDEPSALHFIFLKKVAQKHGLGFLSMGMSSDYEKAITSGATHVRIGTELFGERT